MFVVCALRHILGRLFCKINDDPLSYLAQPSLFTFSLLSSSPSVSLLYLSPSFLSPSVLRLSSFSLSSFHLLLLLPPSPTLVFSGLNKQQTITNLLVTTTASNSNHLSICLHGSNRVTAICYLVLPCRLKCTYDIQYTVVYYLLPCRLKCTYHIQYTVVYYLLSCRLKCTYDIQYTVVYYLLSCRLKCTYDIQYTVVYYLLSCRLKCTYDIQYTVVYRCFGAL